MTERLTPLLRQEGPQQERDELQRWRGWAQFVYLGGGPITLSDVELRAAVCAAHDRQVAALLESPLDPDRPAALGLISRLRDYHDQVLQGFRHISRLEEADLIQAAIDGLRQKEQK